MTTRAPRLMRAYLQASTCKQSLWPLLMWGVMSAAMPAVGCARQPAEAAGGEAPVAVRVVAVRQGDLAQRLSYVGSVQPAQEITVLAQSAGVVVAVVREGAHLAEGDRAAQILTPELAPRVAKVKAERRRAEIERDYWCAVYASDGKLGAGGVITPRQVETSKKACDSATAAATAARASEREMGAVEEKGVERVPFAGVVLQQLVEEGQSVMPGMPLLRFGSLELEVRVQVTEQDLARGVRPGSPALVHGADGEHRLQVARLAPALVGPGRSAEVTLALPPALALDMLPGMSVRVDFVSAEVAQALLVPERALYLEDGEARVFVVEAGQVRAVAVDLGLYDRGQRELRGDLAVGVWVAVSNLEVLQDGAPVLAVHEGAGAEGAP